MHFYTQFVLMVTVLMFLRKDKRKMNQCKTSVVSSLREGSFKKADNCLVLLVT